MWCVYAQLLVDQSKKIFECFVCFWKWFLSLLLWKFFSKSQIFCVKKLSVWQFRDSTCKWMQSHPSCKLKWGNFNFLKIQVESFIAQLRVLHDSNLTHENLPYAFAHFTSNSQVAWKSLSCEMRKKSIFKGLEMLVFQKHCHFVLRDSNSPNHQISSKLNLFDVVKATRKQTCYFMNGKRN